MKLTKKKAAECVRWVAKHQLLVTALTAANKISIVEQIRQLQPKLATQSKWFVSLGWSELSTAHPELVFFSIF